jgi:steroid 5-alpha reductase family enzyme
MNEKIKGISVLCCVYLAALGAGWWVSTHAGFGPLADSALAVATTVCVIFLGSLLFNNSSVFDPYWSIAPPLMVLLYAGGDVVSSRGNILLMLTTAYAVRLTWNFLNGWPGLGHEDWRYADFRRNTGKAYWLVSFSGIHLFPAVMVFGGTLSIWAAISGDDHPLSFLDFLAVVVTAGAILLESAADRQMRNFLASNKESGKTMDRGLWSVSRHPNYLGEILFWWGLYLFALAASPALWWVVAGPVAITLMFIFASIPMIEKRMLKRRTGYAAYREKVSILIPWKKR